MIDNLCEWPNIAEWTEERSPNPQYQYENAKARRLVSAGLCCLETSFASQRMEAATWTRNGYQFFSI